MDYGHLVGIADLRNISAEPVVPGLYVPVYRIGEKRVVPFLDKDRIVSLHLLPLKGKVLEKGTFTGASDVQLGQAAQYSLLMPNPDGGKVIYTAVEELMRVVLESLGMGTTRLYEDLNVFAGQLPCVARI